MEFIIEDITIGEAIANAKRKWLLDHMLHGDTLKACAERFGVSSRTIGRWLNKQHTYDTTKIKLEIKPKQYIGGRLIKDNKCLFCENTSYLEEHHVVNRNNKDNNITVWLCQSCHKVFHALNKKYIKPPAHLVTP